MPEAVLSAVVFLIGLDLIDLDGMRRIYRERRSEFWVALITALMVVLVGVEQGIILAIVLSLIDHTRRGYRPKNALLQPDQTGAWRPQPMDYQWPRPCRGSSSIASPTACTTPTPSNLPRR
jgi:SulP family sulfate permease